MGACSFTWVALLLSCHVLTLFRSLEESSDLWFQLLHVLGCLQGNCGTWISSTEEGAGGCGGTSGVWGRCSTDTAKRRWQGCGGKALPLKILMACELILSMLACLLANFYLSQSSCERLEKCLFICDFMQCGGLHPKCPSRPSQPINSCDICYRLLYCFSPLPPPPF